MEMAYEAFDMEYEEYDVELVHETEKAILIQYGDRQVWLPKSELYEFAEFIYDPNEEITIYVAEWLADIELN
jgi:hypothetical protein